MEKLKGLTHRQRAAARLLAKGIMPRPVAEELGVSYETLLVWQKHNSLFQQEIERQHRLQEEAILKTASD